MAIEGDFFEKVGTEVGSNDDDLSGVFGLDPNAIPPSPAKASHGIRGNSRWIGMEGKFIGAPESTDSLKAGVYMTGFDQAGPYLQRHKIDTDTLIDLPDNKAQEVIGEFKKFWEVGKSFEDRGFIHKRGILLWGPPGSGKTATINLMMQIVVKELDGLVLLLQQPIVASYCLRLVRNIEPTRPIIAVMEDFDALVAANGESGWLALLDGEAQVSNVVFLGTTNYPERLDKRFIDRPSRFDRIIWVDMPSESARAQYLRVKEPSLSAEEIAHWAKLSAGFSIAHLREMIVGVKCFGDPLEVVVGRLNRMRAKRKPSSDQPPNYTGIGVEAMAQGAK